MSLAVNLPLASIPVEVKRVSKQLQGIGLNIRWSSGELTQLASKVLREHCPCATCREKRGDSSHAAPLSPAKIRLNIVKATLEQELDLELVWPVGNYALGMRWGDKHDSGIYTYDYLRELCQRHATQEESLT